MQNLIITILSAISIISVILLVSMAIWYSMSRNSPTMDEWRNLRYSFIVFIISTIILVIVKKYESNSMNIFGIITMISATTMSLVALPMQISKNYKDKKVGLHWTLIGLSFMVYLSRALFALTNETGIIWYIFVSDAIGSVTSAILIWQLFYYKKRQAEQLSLKK